MSELKRCPFCGVELELEEDKEFYIHPIGKCYMNGCAVKNTETRIKAWNTRTPMERIVERLLNMKLIRVEQCHEDFELEVMTERDFDDAIEIVKEEGGMNE